MRDSGKDELAVALLLIVVLGLLAFLMFRLQLNVTRLEKSVNRVEAEVQPE